jgi:ATP-dependent Clp endopeptidase proteolytic subunit ClpP
MEPRGEGRYYQWLETCSVRGSDIDTGCEIQRMLWSRSRVAGDVGWILVSRDYVDPFTKDADHRLAHPGGAGGEHRHPGREWTPTRPSIDGIRFDQWGAPTTFYVLNQEERDSSRKFIPIAARDFVYLPHMTKPDQARGGSCYLTIFDLLAHLDRYVDGVSLAAWMGTVFGLVFKQKSAATQINALGTLTNSNGDQQKAVTLENGMVKYIGTDDDVAQVQSHQPMQQTPDFIRAMYRMLGQPFQMPLEVLALDMSTCNFASARIGLLPFYRNCRIKAAGSGAGGAGRSAGGCRARRTASTATRGSGRTPSPRTSGITSCSSTRGTTPTRSRSPGGPPANGHGHEVAAARHLRARPRRRADPARACGVAGQDRRLPRSPFDHDARAAHPSRCSPPPPPKDPPMSNTGNAVDVLIYDAIGGKEGITATQFVKDLKAHKGKDINLHVNTPGGSVFDGVAIFNALKAHRGHVTTYIDGIAASIGSVIALAGDTVNIASNGFMMIHEASGLVIGNAANMRKQADICERISDTIAHTYAEKTGKPVEEMRALMTAETWFTAQEAIAAGLADSITEAVEFTNSFDLTKFNKAPEALRVPAVATDQFTRARGIAEWRAGAGPFHKGNPHDE